MREEKISKKVKVFEKIDFDLIVKSKNQNSKNISED